MSKPYLPRVMWNAAQDQALIEGVLAGRTRAEIAEELNRTTDAVMARVSILRATGRLRLRTGGKSSPAPQGFHSVTSRVQIKGGPRPCMCCGKPFNSAGSHNRLCPTCGRKSLSPYDSAAHIVR